MKNMKIKKIKQIVEKFFRQNISDGKLDGSPEDLISELEKREKEFVRRLFEEFEKYNYHMPIYDDKEHKLRSEGAVAISRHHTMFLLDLVGERERDDRLEKK